jgi:predicted RNase H-like HicB family nuclease
MKKYLVIFETTKTGYSAYVPDLPGCVASGRNKEQAEKNIYEAIQFHIEGLAQEKRRIPVATTSSEVFVF